MHPARPHRGSWLLYLLMAALLCVASSVAIPARTLPGEAIEGLTENRGQIASAEGDSVRFAASSGSTAIQLTDRGISFAFFSRTPQASAREDRSGAMASARPRDTIPAMVACRIDLMLIGARAHPVMVAEEQTGELRNYYSAGAPAGITGVASFRRITYRDIYDGIDFIIRCGSSGLTYEFAVKPGGDPSRIRLRYSGARSVSIAGDGALSIEHPLGTLRESAPFTYLLESGESIPSSFHLSGDTISFAIHRYARQRTLVIDPTIFWSTYLGGGQIESGADVACDRQRNMIVAGSSTSLDFPTSGGVLQSSLRGARDCWISKFDPNGVRLWTTFYGGTSEDVARRIAIDTNGRIAVAGNTESPDFPTSPGAYQPEMHGSNTKASPDYRGDAFVVVLEPDGTRRWGTCIGGVDDDYAAGVAFDQSGGVIIGGATYSTDFPVTPDALVPGGGSPVTMDAIVAHFDSTGRLLWSSYLVSPADDEILGVAVARNGTILLCGRGGVGLPTSPDAIEKTPGALTVGYLARLSSAHAFLWGTFFGGSAVGACQAISSDGANGIVVSGTTLAQDLPVTSGAIQTTNQGSYDGFVARMDPSGGLLWSTYLGGEENDSPQDIDVAQDGTIALAGWTESAGMPTTIDAVQATLKGTQDAFVVKLAGSGGLLWSTYLGGSNLDQAFGVAIDDEGGVIVAGTTTSGNFPTTPGAFQTELKGTVDAFVTKLGCSTPGAIVSSGPLALCDGTSVQLDAGPDFLAYRWSTGETTRTITTAIAGEYSVTVTDRAGCTSSIGPVQVTVRPPIHPTVAQICFCDSVLLLAPDGFTSYRWSDGGTGRAHMVYPPTTDLLSVTDPAGCTGASDSIHVPASGAAMVALVPEMLHAPPGDTIAATLRLIGQSGAGSCTVDHVAIRFNGTVLAPAGARGGSIRNDSIAADHMRTVTVNLEGPEVTLMFVAGLGNAASTPIQLLSIAYDSCVSPVDTLLLATVAIDSICYQGGARLLEMDPRFLLKVTSPPGAQSQATVEFDTPENGGTSIEVVDIAGRSVARLQEDLAAGHYERTIDLRNTGSGLYLVVLRTPSQIATARLLLVK